MLVTELPRPASLGPASGYRLHIKLNSDCRTVEIPHYHSSGRAAKLCTSRSSPLSPPHLVNLTYDKQRPLRAETFILTPLSCMRSPAFFLSSFLYPWESRLHDD